MADEFLITAEPIRPNEIFTCATPWSKKDQATPLGDINAAITLMHTMYGKKPKTLLLDCLAMRWLRVNREVLNFFMVCGLLYSGADVAEEESVMNMLSYRFSLRVAVYKTPLDFLHVSAPRIADFRIRIQTGIKWASEDSYSYAWLIAPY